MDIIVPQGIDFDHFGGKLAREWSACSANNEKQVENYETKVIPHVTKTLTPFFNISQNVESLPPVAEQRPITYVIGNDGSWKPTQSELHERSKKPSKGRNFEEAKRTGKIALNPMLNCMIFGSATPKIQAAKVTKNVYLTQRYDGIGASLGGVCRSNWWAWPELSLDSFAGQCRVNRTWYTDVIATPVPTSEIDRLMRMVKGRLDSVEPDSSLVTQVVSEANAASWDIATEIAEAPETIKYILNGLKQGILLILRAKREIKQNLSSGNVKTDIASIWMQYRYALMPIVYSVNDALDVLGMDVVKFQSFRGRKDAPLFDEENDFGGYSIKSVPQYQNRVFLKYKYDIDSDIHQGLKINLASTAWELVPLSFVFDWFFQVGDYLTAAFRPSSVEAYGCQYSVRCQGPLVLEGDSSETIQLDIDYYRSRIIKPNAFIGINSDVFISFKRSMDALALSWLLFGKKRRG